ncbi:carboxypeptidase-like regulatory domain-containing protein [Aeoliella straminimaris]|nr:carboxypeptidase-like regulatory domain-containing protein [Aeoliella straminimaris]
MAAALLLSGCSTSDPMAVVTGVVTVGTTPVGPCSVQFHPVGGGRPIATTTEGEGSYQIALPPGTYNVVVRPSVHLPEGWKEGDPVPDPPVAVPKDYTQATTTKLQVKVEQPQDFTKDLQM